MLLYVLLIGLYVVLMSGFLFWVIRRRRKIVEEIQREFSGETVLASTPKANYFGQQSAGMLRVRGNGILLLTPKELHFRMYAPGSSLEHPRLGPAIHPNAPFLFWKNHLSSAFTNQLLGR